jgi:steroid delta-isomerase-like uncharacterized protein
MTYAEITAFLRAHEAKFNRHDINGLAADFTDEGVVRSPIFPLVQGVVQIQSSYRALFTMFPDMQITFEPAIIDGDRAAHPFTARATHVGEFMGMPGTGRKFQIIGALFYQFDDGLIAEQRRIYDFTGLLMQVGVLKGKPSRGDVKDGA